MVSQSAHAASNHEPESQDSLKRCSRCRTWKPAHDFYRHAKWKDGRHPWCKECFLAACRHRWQSHGQRSTTRRWSRYRGLREDYFADLIVESATGVRIGGPWKKTQGVSVIRCYGKAAEDVDLWLHEDGFGLERKRIPRPPIEQ